MKHSSFSAIENLLPNFNSNMSILCALEQIPVWCNVWDRRWRYIPRKYRIFTIHSNSNRTSNADGRLFPIYFWLVIDDYESVNQTLRMNFLHGFWERSRVHTPFLYHSNTCGLEMSNAQHWRWINPLKSIFDWIVKDIQIKWYILSQFTLSNHTKLAHSFHSPFKIDWSNSNCTKIDIYPC